MQLSEDATDERLESWPVARLGSRADDERPDQAPIVFARLGGRLWSPVNGKSKRSGELVRVRNLRAHPEISLLLDDYDSDWTQLWWIRIDATAQVLQPVSANDPEVSAAIAALEAKYPQYATVPVLRADPTLIAFEPGRIVNERPSESL
jgi:PPOX class probable F420-dependent enzyme